MRGVAAAGWKDFRVVELQKNEPKRLKSLSRAQNRTLDDIVNFHATLGPGLPRPPFRSLRNLYEEGLSQRSRQDERAAKAGARGARRGGEESRRGAQSVLSRQRSARQHDADLRRRAGPDKASRV